MPILRSLPLWPNPQESIGRQIPSSRVGNRMVWWPRGPALEIFEKAIQPEIENILKVVDLGHADLFIRLYMIGRKPESANPIVMVCCTNSKARGAAESSIRESSLLCGYKGFGLGGAALPLEHPTPVRRLSPQSSTSSTGNAVSSRSMSGFSDMSSPSNIQTTNPPVHRPYGAVQHALKDSQEKENSSPFIIDTPPKFTGSNNSSSGQVVFASSIEPSLGRRISTSTSGHVSHHYATAGVVIQVGENYYQLTAGHLFGADSNDSDEEQSHVDLDECHFDGQSDDDEHNSDYELEARRRGSATPEDTLSSSSSSMNDESIRSYNTDVTRDSQPIQHERDKTLTPVNMQNPVSTDNKFLQNPSTIGPRLPIGYLPHGRSFQASIDYAIIAISRDSVDNMNWTINRTFWPFKFVKDCVEIGHEERDIVVVTYSKVIEGHLIPGKVAFRDQSSHSSSEIHEPGLPQAAPTILPLPENADSRGPTGTVPACLTCRRKGLECDGSYPCSRCSDSKLHCGYRLRKSIFPRISLGPLLLSKDYNYPELLDARVGGAPVPPTSTIRSVSDTPKPPFVTTPINETLQSSQNHRPHQFKRLSLVMLKGEVYEGDCGSPVLDSSSGSLYGHIIMGVAGTKVAYIVPAVDIFRDIETRTGKPVSIVTKEDSEKMKTPDRSHTMSSSVPSHPLRNQDLYTLTRPGDDFGSSRSTRSSRVSSSASTSTSISTGAPSKGILPCEFVGYGGCAQTFDIDDVNDWIEHIISVHLQEKLPETVLCWFCDDHTFDYKNVGDRRVNFENRMWHIRSHFLEGLSVHDIRPDHFLNTHLQKHGLVPDYAYHVVRRYTEVPQPNWILPHDGDPMDWESGNSRGQNVINDPIDQKRKNRKRLHKKGKSRK